MAYTNLNSEDRLVQETFAEHLREQLGWESVYAWKRETLGPHGTLGRTTTREVVLIRDLRAALARINPELPMEAIDEAIGKLTSNDFSRSLLQHNQEYHNYIRDGIPVSYRDAMGEIRSGRARPIDFANGATDGVAHNRFLAVRELKIQGVRAPHYNRRADLVCFVNGLPLVFIELKAVYKNIRAAYDGNLRDYMEEHVIAQMFHHNAFIVVSNGDHARYGSITSRWERFAEWKRNDEREKGNLGAETLLDGMLRPDRLLDIVENFILFDASKPGQVRKVVARNHQVLGVNESVGSVRRQEELKREFPPERRLRYQVRELPKHEVMDKEMLALSDPGEGAMVTLVEPAHPDLGKLGVFWHTQASVYLSSGRRRPAKRHPRCLHVDGASHARGSRFRGLAATTRG